MAAVVNEVQNRVDDELARVKSEQTTIKAKTHDCQESIKTLAQSAKFAQTDLDKSRVASEALFR